MATTCWSTDGGISERAASQYGIPRQLAGMSDLERDAEMMRQVAELTGQFAESAKLEKAIKANLGGLGYGE